MSAPSIANLDMVTPFVEMGVGSIYTDSSTAQWDVTEWDEPGEHWASDQSYWYDVTCHVREVSTFAGRERAIDQFEIGTATIVMDNTSGWADYPITMGDLETIETLLVVRPGRAIRVGVIAFGTRYVLWGGFIDAANPTYEAGTAAMMTLECIDAKGDAGRTEIQSLAAPVGAGETVTQRITRILNMAGWPAYRRDIDSAGIALRANEMGGQAVDLLDQAADSAGGTVYGDLGTDTSDPRVAFRSRDWPNYDMDAVPIGTIGNYGYTGIPAHFISVEIPEDPVGSGLYDPATTLPVEDPIVDGLYVTSHPDVAANEDPHGSMLLTLTGEYVPYVPGNTCPSSWELSFGRQDITTQTLLGRPDEPERIYPTPAQLAVSDNGFAQGLAMFGVETLTRNDLDTNADADLDWMAERILTTRSWKFMPRISAVTVTAKAGQPETIHTLAKASPFSPSRFRCQHRIDNRTIFNRLMMVVGVEHSITPEMWTARIALDDAEPFLVAGAQPARWDETGVAEWDFATWADPT